MPNSETIFDFVRYRRVRKSNYLAKNIFLMQGFSGPANNFVAHSDDVSYPLPQMVRGN